ncbi:MAG: NAD(P)/FAD-dependent oxidoreductase [Clostridia bacterium]|nr:NAD(P)/FAD-dependent oxidoreductase [Clostridia bacterium]
MYDVIVIGGGIVGCAILDKLSTYQLDCLLLEKEEDVSCGCSKANSGIVHAGYDALPNTLKARFNVRGNTMYYPLAEQLGVPINKCGSLVLANESGLEQLRKLYTRGINNGVTDMQILDRNQLYNFEHNIADNIMYGLYAKSAGVVSPYEMTIALAERAVLNGSLIITDSEVVGIKNINGSYVINTQNGEYRARVLINASGYGADTINRLANQARIDYVFSRGDYYVLDSTERPIFNHICFPLPNEKGKGVLVAPTADGNVIAGPTSMRVENGTDTAVKKDGLDYIKQSVNTMLKNVNLRKVIRVFAGVRAVAGDDFIINRNNNFVTVAGICSPGLTSAPAIAEYVVEELVAQTGLELRKKDVLIDRKKPIITRDMSNQQWQELIRVNPAYGRMVCRCERITEGEILDAINSPLSPSSLDALKRRVRVGMGRCQGGFCTARVMEIIAREKGIHFDDITKKGKGSEVVVSAIKEAIIND